MNDKIIHVDLSNEVPSERALFRYELEKATVRVNKTGIEVNSESFPGTPQNKALTTLYLAVAIAAITGVTWAIGIPAIAAIATGLGTTISLYLLVHFTSGGRTHGTAQACADKTCADLRSSGTSL